MYPTLFKIGPFVFGTIWIFVGISVYVFLKLLVKAIQKNRGDFKFLYQNSTALIIGFFIGARFTHVATNFSYYFYDFSLHSFLSTFTIWDKGFSFWGGLITVLFMIYMKTRTRKESFKKWMDYMTEPFLYALPIAYLGKFLDGMGYGTKTDLPIGIAFKNMNVSIIDPVHPTQIYSMTLLIIAILIFRHVQKSKPKLRQIKGARSSFAIGLISTILLIEHLFRGDPTVEIFNVRAGVYISLVIAIASWIYLIKNIKKSK
ncbi:hypothetical protein HOG48_03605 [Candidatus Peregrinibacteria bacterium]|jgi:prolipoprotein diacylglyceryltransferase|nr:hypothetical protein [Candidatus Peregrinibacteria bacterium]